jgi:hypothetical protein
MGMFDYVLVLDDRADLCCPEGHPLRSFQTKDCEEPSMATYLLSGGRLYCALGTDTWARGTWPAPCPRLRPLRLVRSRAGPHGSAPVFRRPRERAPALRRLHSHVPTRRAAASRAHHRHPRGIQARTRRPRPVCARRQRAPGCRASGARAGRPLPTCSPPACVRGAPARTNSAW